MDVSQIAEICHEANRAYCKAISDTSQVPWDEAPDWQKESCVNGVENIMANPSTTPEQSHQNWLEHKVADGWKFGPVKDADKKEHPCMVPYDELPHEQKVKDRLFRAIVLITSGLSQPTE